MNTLKRKLLLTITVCILTLTGTLPARAGDIVTVGVTAIFDQTGARSMLSMINDFRLGDEAWQLKEGEDVGGERDSYVGQLSTLEYDYTLERVAMQRAMEIAIHYDHTRPNGEVCFTAFPGSGLMAMGENIAAGYQTAVDVFEGWQETYEPYDGQGHRRNMLSKDFTCIGIGHVIYNGEHFWAQAFGSPTINNAETTPSDSEETWNVDVDTDRIVSAKLQAENGVTSLDVEVGSSVDMPEAQVLLKTVNYWSNYGLGYVDPYLEWQIENQEIAEIRDGKLYGENIGTTKATATFLDQTCVIEISVVAHIIDLEENSDQVTITVSPESFVYTGSEPEFTVTVSFDGIALQEDIDYSIDYDGRIDAGTATLTVKGKGNYSGAIPGSFTILPADLSEAVMEGLEDLTYDGSEQFAAPVIRYGDIRLIEGLDYTVGYTARGNDPFILGSVTVEAEGIGNYSGILKGTYKIVEPETEPATEEVTEPATEEVTEPDTEEITEPQTEEITEPDIEEITKPQTEEITEPDTEEVTEPDTEEITEPDTEEITEPDTEEITEPQTEEITEPNTEEITEPQTEEITEPETEEITEPQTEEITEPQTEEITELETEEITEPQTEEITEPQTEEITEPETERITEPEPETEKTTESEPETEKSTEKEPEAETGSGDTSGSGTPSGDGNGTETGNGAGTASGSDKETGAAPGETPDGQSSTGETPTSQNNTEETKTPATDTGSDGNVEERSDIENQPGYNCPDPSTLPKPGTKFSDTASGGTYKITNIGNNGNPQVQYTKPAKSGSKIVVPAVVTLKGVKYKVTSVAAKAFKGNKKLKTVVIGKNVTTIGSNAFNGCTKLTSVTIGANVTEIGASAFAKCTALKKIVIPAKVKKIGKKAFYGAKKLKAVQIKSTKLTAKTIGSQAFKGIASKATFKLPKAKVSAYKTILLKKGATKKMKFTK